MVDFPSRFEVIVIGGGHAGCEAAAARGRRRRIHRGCGRPGDRSVDNPAQAPPRLASALHGEKMTAAFRFIHSGCGWADDNRVDKRRRALRRRRVKKHGEKLTAISA